MRIKKNAIQGSDSSKIEQRDYIEATQHIQDAITSLGKAATSGDVLAKESIANLSVVLLDLK